MLLFVWFNLFGYAIAVTTTWQPCTGWGKRQVRSLCSDTVSMWAGDKRSNHAEADALLVVEMFNCICACKYGHQRSAAQLVRQLARFIQIKWFILRHFRRKEQRVDQERVDLMAGGMVWHVWVCEWPSICPAYVLLILRWPTVSLSLVS